MRLSPGSACFAATIEHIAGIKTTAGLLSSFGWEQGMAYNKWSYSDGDGDGDGDGGGDGMMVMV